MKTSSFKAQDLLKAKTLAPVLFVGMGVYKGCKDYKTADEKHKEKVLLKDAVILSSSALGYAASYTLVKHCPNIKIVDNTVRGLSKCLNKAGQNKFIKEKIAPYFQKAVKPIDKTTHAVHTSLNYIEEAIKECLKAGCITLGSIGAALGANEGVNRYLFKKPKEQPVNELKDKSIGLEKYEDVHLAPPEEVAEGEKNAVNELEKAADEPVKGKNAFENFIVKTKSNDYVQVINSEFSKDPANKVFASFSFLSVMRVLDFPMTAVAGFDISKEKDMEEKVKRTSYSLIANIFVPTFMISIVSALTKRVKNAVKIPVLAATTMAGIAIGTVLGRAAEKKIEKNLHFK